MSLQRKSLERVSDDTFTTTLLQSLNKIYLQFLWLFCVDSKIGFTSYDDVVGMLQREEWGLDIGESPPTNIGFSFRDTGCDKGYGWGGDRKRERGKGRSNISLYNVSIMPVVVQ